MISIPHPQPNTTSSIQNLSGLIADLSTTKLCNINDYVGVSITNLNDYLSAHPIKHEYLGDIQSCHLESDGTVIPEKMVKYENEEVAGEIARQLGNWIIYNPKYGGRMTTSQGAFIYEQTYKGPLYVMPDVAYTPRSVHRVLTADQLRTYKGAPFSPSFVVEVDLLSGVGSKSKELDRKMREIYFKSRPGGWNGVELGWLIDPTNKIMIEYTWNSRRSSVVKSQEERWRDLDASPILPGFVVEAADLDGVLAQEEGSSDEDVVDVSCPRCGEKFDKDGLFMQHYGIHLKAGKNKR